MGREFKGRIGITAFDPAPAPGVARCAIVGGQKPIRVQCSGLAKRESFVSFTS